MIPKESIVEDLPKDFESMIGRAPGTTVPQSDVEFRRHSELLPPQTTDEQRAPRALVSIASVLEPPRELPLTFGPDKARSIKGVVAEVDETNVRVNCQLAPNTISISLPRALFTDALAKFGTPISIEIVTSQNYRRMAISHRDIAPPEPDPELEDLEKWANE